MPKGVIIAALALLALVGLPAAAQTGTASVVDGDTIDVAGTRVRLWGIDAPESAQMCERSGVGYACGQQASAHLRLLIGDAGVSCQSRTKDRYGRTVAVCRAGTVDIGAAMVRDGWAMAFVRYSVDYVAEEREARDAKRGLWAGSFTSPWDWRAAHRRTLN
jgi:endonuclease YncB( thermonuclease family)